MSTYYNEIDRHAAQWLRNLAGAGHIAAGIVDEHSIADVRPDDVRSFRQCHWFAGIGGWSYALALAGWPAGREVWTGSCPCQPFSSAGKQGGESDARHLWPAWFRLIRECRPDCIFGEQVEGSVGFGWLDRVFADLEVEGYACGAAVLGAHSVGAPHIRQRLFWVADAGGNRQSTLINVVAQSLARQTSGGLAYSGAVGGVGDAALDGRRQECAQFRGGSEGNRAQGSTERSRLDYWSGAEWLSCLDGKARRIEPGIQPLAHELPAAVDGLGPVSRIGALRGAGNAIVPPLAAEFIKAFMECSAPWSRAAPSGEVPP